MRRALDAENLVSSARARYNIELVFEEIVSNILRYGAPHGRECRISAHIRRDAACIRVTIEDDGIPFDPSSSSTDGGVIRTLDDAREGGFGLMIVRHFSSAMHYERTAEQRNRLTVTLSATG